MKRIPIEVTVYRDGKLFAGMYFHMIDIIPRYETRFTIPGRQSELDRINVSFICDGEAMNGWIAFRVSLINIDGMPLAAVHRPTLVFDGPSDCPSVTLIPSLHPDEPLSGVYAVHLRVSADYRPDVAAREVTA